jgi:hypothetical protein
MSRLLPRSLLALAVCSAVSPAARAQNVAFWDFGTMNLPGQNTWPQFAPSTSNPNLTITNIQIGSGNFNMEVDSPTGTGGVTYPTAPFNRAFAPTVVSNTEAAGLANDVYFFFTITPNPGFALKLSGFSTQVGRGGAGGNRATYIYDDIDGFTAGASITKLETIANDLTLTRPNSATITADLTAARYQNLTAPITFRAYVVTDGAGQSMDFDNVTVTGTVIVVPEPACVLALAASAGGIWTLRRRRSENPAQVSATVTSDV